MRIQTSSIDFCMQQTSAVVEKCDVSMKDHPIKVDLHEEADILNQI